jgi:hypothetical protein
MVSRFWQGVLPALLALVLLASTQRAWAATTHPLVSNPYSYSCRVIYGDLGLGEQVTCNNIPLPRLRPFYTATLAPGQTISISGQVTSSSGLVRNTAYLWIQHGSTVEKRQISVSGTVSWVNTTGVAQNVQLSWHATTAAPYSSYTVKGQVSIE